MVFFLNFSREQLLKFIHERKEDKAETWDKLKDHEYDPDGKNTPPPEPPKEGYGDTIPVPEVTFINFHFIRAKRFKEYEAFYLQISLRIWLFMSIQ